MKDMIKTSTTSNILNDLDGDFIIEDSFGTRLNSAIKLKGASRKEIANLLDVSLSAISHYCHDKRKPSLESMRSIAVYLQIPIGYFFGEISLIEALQSNDSFQQNILETREESFHSLDRSKASSGYIPIIEIQDINGEVKSLEDATMKSYLSIPNQFINTKGKKFFAISASRNSMIGMKNKKNIIIYEKTKSTQHIDQANSIYLLHIKVHNNESINKLFVGRCINVDSNILLFNEDKTTTSFVLNSANDSFEVVGKAVLSWNYLN